MLRIQIKRTSEGMTIELEMEYGGLAGWNELPCPSRAERRAVGLELNNTRTLGFKYLKRNQHKLVGYSEKFVKQMQEYFLHSYPRERNAIGPQEDGTRIRD